MYSLAILINEETSWAIPNRSKGFGMNVPTTRDILGRATRDRPGRTDKEPAATAQYVGPSFVSCNGSPGWTGAWSV